MSHTKPNLLSGQYDAAGRKLYQDDCPARYTGPIEAADGQRPFNSYLWPTESWWPDREPGQRSWDATWHFGIVALWDGSFAVNGFIWQIECNDRRSSWHQREGQLHRPNNFPTRRQAIRTAAADVLRQLRNARHRRPDWLRGPDWQSRVTRDGAHWVDVCNWVRRTVHRETGYPCRPPRLATYTPPPPPTAPDLAADLPLFGGALVAA